MDSTEELAEATAAKKAVDMWCNQWKVDRERLEETVVIDPDHEDLLIIEVTAPLLVPITSVKTRLLFKKTPKS